MMFSPKKIQINPKEYLDKRFEIKDSFKPYNQRNDIFNRSDWDESIDPKKFFISYDITNYSPKKSKA